tara:strand:+ start:5003 stop:5671 length:669 start_codon:yes stop_codon:yes gene_type:complete
MRTAAFIPIKSNSERVKGKNFRLFLGKPLYQHIIQHALEAKCFEKIYVDTDSKEIQEYCASLSVSTIQREPALVRNDANGNDLLSHHYDLYPDYDCYAQLFATAPLLKPETINSCIRKMHLRYHNADDTSGFDSILTGTTESGWFWYNGQPVNFRPGILPRSQDATGPFKESTGLYAILGSSLRKYRCRTGAKPILSEISQLEAIDLDTEQDFRLAEIILEQ